TDCRNSARPTRPTPCASMCSARRRRATSATGVPARARCAATMEPSAPAPMTTNLIPSPRSIASSLAVAKPRQQKLAFPLRRHDAVPLDVPVAADLLGQAGEPDRGRQPADVQAGQQPAQVLLVLVDQAALGAPFLGATERIEHCTAQ